MNISKRFGIAAMLLGTSLLAGAQDTGKVFTMTNAASGNSVVAFMRGADGKLTAAGTFDTMGKGSGAGLGSQSAVALSKDGKWLFAVNAGSNEISVFSVQDNGLTLTDKVDSGGTMPISLTNYGNLLYVLNAAPGLNNITGFMVSSDGKLKRISNSTRRLSSFNTGPAQIGFDPTGRVLVVTEKNANMIDLYWVGVYGTPFGPMSYYSVNATPFGFDFDNNGHLITSEAAGGASNMSTASSYSIFRGLLYSNTIAAPTKQTAACWAVVSPNGQYAYTTNTGSGSVTGFSIGAYGDLTPLNVDGRTGLTGDGSKPIDAGFSGDGKYLYALGSGSSAITEFAANADGSLNSIGTVSVPAGSVGLAVR